MNNDKGDFAPERMQTLERVNTEKVEDVPSGRELIKLEKNASNRSMEHSNGSENFIEGESRTEMNGA